MANDNYIQTQHGVFVLDSMESNAVDITDIAHALSHICRFTGHTKYPYSVAQHSVLCSLVVPSELALEALLHDAHEAIVSDIAAPIKALPQMAGYVALCDQVQGIIARQFGIPKTMSREVKIADLRMCQTERFVLLPQGYRWGLDDMGIKPYRNLIIARWAPEYACFAFLERFYELTTERE